MRALENVLLLGPTSLDEVAAFVSDALDVQLEPGGEGLRGLLESTDSVGVYHADYVNERGWDLERYAFVVDVEGDRQRHIARTLFDAFAASTRWDLLWLTDDGGRIADRRTLAVAR